MTLRRTDSHENVLFRNNYSLSLWGGDFLSVSGILKSHSRIINSRWNLTAKAFGQNLAQKIQKWSQNLVPQNGVIKETKNLSKAMAV